jgi:hypothetical protein
MLTPLLLLSNQMNTISQLLQQGHIWCSELQGFGTGMHISKHRVPKASHACVATSIGIHLVAITLQQDREILVYFTLAQHCNVLSHLPLIVRMAEKICGRIMVVCTIEEALL